MRRALLLAAIPLLAAAAAAPAAAAGPHRVVVAVLDSGLDAHDPALAGAVAPGHDFVAGGSDTFDDLGHGTAVAAVTAGACPRCLVMPVRVIDSSGHASAGAIAAGISWAVDHGASVVNMSFVMPAPDAGVAAAVADALRHGVLLVAGAGNSGPGGPVLYPAAYPGVLAVAATGPRDRLEPWSSRGAWVRVAAPGCSSPRGAGGAPTEFCGTSSATAVVSGVLGLALASDPGVGASTLLARLADTSVPVAGVAWGRVDATALLRSLAARAPAAQAP